MKDYLEFSWPVDVVRLGPDGGSYDIVASTEQRAALARRFDLLALDHLSAQVTLKPVAGGFYRLAATLEAVLKQACVATLEPVASRVEETFSLLYGALEAQKEVLLDGESETVEPLEGGMIDIGEAVAQQLSLAIDPFPRAANAPPQADASASSPLDSPFAVLAKLRPTREG